MYIYLLSSGNKTMLSIILTIVGAICLIVCITLINEFVIKRNRLRKNAKDLEKKYFRIHELLTQDVEKSVERLYNISLQNDDYKKYHEEFQNDYQKILEENDKNSYVAVSGLNQTIADKKYSGLNSVVDSTKVTVNEFSRKVENLFEDLNNLLQKDEEFHQKEVSLQRKYRDIKAKYSEHEQELYLMKDTFYALFTKIENIFKECEELTNSARYEESASKLPVISDVINELSKYFDELPAYCIRTTKVIPQNIEELKAKYDEFEKKEYPLHHLKINTKLEVYNATLTKIASDLKGFKLANVGASLDAIDQELLNIRKALDYEEECKLYFDKNCNDIYRATYEIEKRFMKIKRQLPNYKKVYLITDKYLEKIDQLQKDIDNIAKIKSELDTYIHSQMKQPYSIICQKIKDMDNEMKRIDQVISEFQTYLASLKKDTEEAYVKICSYFNKLKDAQFEVREMSVNEYSKQMRPRFLKAYDYLEKIGEIISAQPINVAKANELIVACDDFVAVLLNDVKNGVGQRKYAEESIVYANQYVQDFAEVSSSVENASLAFFQGDFNSCIHETVEIIKKIRPESQEQFR